MEKRKINIAYLCMIFCFVGLHKFYLKNHVTGFLYLTFFAVGTISIFLDTAITTGLYTFLVIANSIDFLNLPFQVKEVNSKYKG